MSLNTTLLRRKAFFFSLFSAVYFSGTVFGFSPDSSLHHVFRGMRGPAMLSPFVFGITTQNALVKVSLETPDYILRSPLEDVRSYRLKYHKLIAQVGENTLTALSPEFGLIDWSKTFPNLLEYQVYYPYILVKTSDAMLVVDFKTGQSIWSFSHHDCHYFQYLPYLQQLLLISDTDDAMPHALFVSLETGQIIRDIPLDFIPDRVWMDAVLKRTYFSKGTALTVINTSYTKSNITVAAPDFYYSNYAIHTLSSSPTSSHWAIRSLITSDTALVSIPPLHNDSAWKVEDGALYMIQQNGQLMVYNSKSEKNELRYNTTTPFTHAPLDMLVHYNGVLFTFSDEGLFKWTVIVSANSSTQKPL